MEASLAAVADAGVDIRHALFDRFFAAFPDRRASFMIVDASSRRMTDETLKMMLGLAKGESWGWPLGAELVFTHRAYWALPIEDYDSFTGMTVEEQTTAAGPTSAADKGDESETQDHRTTSGARKGTTTTA